MQVKVITFNMQFGQTWDPDFPNDAPIRLDWTVSELKKHDADIVLLQEVEKVEPEKGQIYPPPNFTQLQEALPQYYSYFSYPTENPRELPFGFGLAILSKTPLFDTRAIDLPAPSVKFQFNGKTTSLTDRLLIGAKTKLGKKDLQIFNTHLQAFFVIGHSSDEFLQQRNIISEYLRTSTLPTILGGDFNTAPDESTVEQFEAAGFQTAQRNSITWRRQPYTLDHIFYNIVFKLKSSEICETLASDHKVVIAALEL